MFRRQIRGLYVLLGAAGLSAQQAAHVTQPAASVADELKSYDEWLHGSRTTVPLVAADLDATRHELARIAPIFLVPLQGAVSALKGVCPTLTFAIAGSAVSTSATTQYERGSCGLVSNGSTVRAIRQTDASLPAARLAVELAGDVTPQSAIGEAVTPKSARMVDERQRRLLTTFALEFAEIGSIKQPAAAARLIEWACPYVRGHASVDDFDSAWQLAALAVLEGGVDADTLKTHLDHAQPAFPHEPRLILARAIAEEQATAPPLEATYVPADGENAARTASLLARAATDHARAADRAIARFSRVLKNPVW